jgi:hypothetical protein
MEPANDQLENPWDFFPLAMCINLLERDDRLEQAKQEFRNAGLRRVVFYRSSRQPDRDKVIIDSHMACLRYAVDQDAPYVLIFEDDAQFLDGYDANLRRAVDLMKSRRDWDIFHLGGFIFRKVERVTPHIVRGGIMTVHGYVISQKLAKLALEKRPYCSGMSIDLFYHALNGDAAFACVYPPICIQRASPSDGTWERRRANRRLADEGWLGNAQIYTSLDRHDKWRFNRFTLWERSKIEQGLVFFKIWGGVCRNRLRKTEKKVTLGQTPAIAEYPIGQYKPVELRDNLTESQTKA